MFELLLGFNTACWLFTIGGGVYVAWRYVYEPWKIVRADQAALNEKLRLLASDLEAFKEELGKRKAISFTPEQVAGMEREQRMRLLQGSLERGLSL